MTIISSSYEKEKVSKMYPNTRSYQQFIGLMQFVISNSQQLHTYQKLNSEQIIQYNPFTTATSWMA